MLLCRCGWFSLLSFFVRLFSSCLSLGTDMSVMICSFAVIFLVVFMPSIFFFQTLFSFAPWIVLTNIDEWTMSFSVRSFWIFISRIYTHIHWSTWYWMCDLFLRLFLLLLRCYHTAMPPMLSMSNIFKAHRHRDIKLNISIIHSHRWFEWCFCLQIKPARCSRFQCKENSILTHRTDNYARKKKHRKRSSMNEREKLHGR